MGGASAEAERQTVGYELVRCAAESRQMKWLLTAVVLISGGLWWDTTYNHGTIGRAVSGIARDIRQNFGV